SSARNAAEESLRTSAPDVPRTASSEDTTATCSLVRRSAASRSMSVSAFSAHRTSSWPWRSSGPCPSNTSTPRAPLAATQLASRSRSSSGERNSPACRRLKPSKRYSVGSATPLSPRLVEEDGGGDAHVQRLDAAELRDRDLEVARPPDERPQALSLRAEDERKPAGEVGLPHRRPRLAGGARDPQVRALDVGEVAGEIRHDCDRQVLHRAGGRAADGRGHPRRPMRRHHDARRPRALGAAADGAEVARVADLIEAGEQRSLALGELIRVRVLVWLAPGEHALVVARPRLLGDVALELRLDTRPLELAQPRLGLDRTLGRPQLQHLPLPAQHLPHRPPPVDLFAAHRGTSWKPSAASRTIQPAAAI